MASESDDVSGSAYDAVLKDVQDRNFGTSDSDLRSYAQTGGAAGGAAACTALGAPEAAPICATIGGKIGGAIYDGLKWLTHSGPDPSELQGARQATVDALRAAFVTSANAAVEKTYDTIRQATRATGQQASDAQISDWLSDVADRFGFWYVTGNPSAQIVPGRASGPGAFTWCIACNAPRDPNVAGGFGQHMTSESDATVAAYRAKTLADFGNIVHDLRACAVGVLALLAANAIHVGADDKGKFLALPRATFTGTFAEPSASLVQPKPTKLETPARVAIGAAVGAVVGGGIGMAVDKRKRKRGAMVGALGGALAGGLVGAAL